MRLIPFKLECEDGDTGGFWDQAAHLVGEGFGDLEDKGHDLLHDVEHPFEDFEGDAEGLYDNFEDGEDEEEYEQHPSHHRDG